MCIRDSYGEYVWRVSADGADTQRLVTRASSRRFSPTSLSVSPTSARLLVTSRYTKQLTQFASFGDELRRVQLPDNMEQFHAVESPTMTFIVNHENIGLQPNHCQISEVDRDGQVLRQFTGSSPSSLGRIQHIAIDSHSNVFVADSDNRCIWLLDAQLTQCRIIIDEHELPDKRPSRLCYRASTGQLLVGSYFRVAVFDLLN